jgi:oxygen-dependent protoporphyrinogen oxidase
VVIGGGITGMSCAYELSKARQSGASFDLTLIERDQRLGGKIVTERLSDGFVIEGGPDSFVGQKPQALALARELGLGDELDVPAKLRHSSYVLINGRPRPMPEGLMLIIPSKLAPFARTGMLSLLGKLRMACDLLVPPRREPGDESVADFIRRRLGREALDRLAEPLMAGIHSADVERQSLLATFPRFQAMEQQYGSLLGGMLAQKRQAATKPTHSTANPFAHSPFVTLRSGIQTLVEALEPRLAATIMRGVEVVQIERNRLAHTYQLRLDDGQLLEADAVVVTTPSYTAANLLEPLAPELTNALQQIRYVSTGTITLAYRRSAVGHLLDGYGLIIPRSEQRRINACTISSQKFANRAPDDHVLVRVFVGGSRTPEALQLNDNALLTMVREELQALLGIVAEPVFSRVYRWMLSNPQYDVGHLDRIARMRLLTPNNIILAGSAYDGVGLPDCIRQGQAAAQQVLAQIPTFHP